MLSYIEYLNLPTKVVVIVVGVLLLINIVGELLEFKGKVVPEYVKARKYFCRKRREKKEEIETLKEVKLLLSEVNQNYSQDNITKRNKWMQWVNDRAEVYDLSVLELAELKASLDANNELTLDLYIDITRNRIIDFASKVINENVAVSHEEFRRIFKVYEQYEKILEKYNKTNGEVDIAYRIITESYEEHMKHHSFVEDVRGYH